MGAILAKYRRCFLYQNSLQIETLYPKNEARLVSGKSVRAHHNTPSHRADSTQKFLEKYNMWLMSRPPYSPDLAPYDFFIFPKLKLVLKGQHLGHLEGIKSQTAAYLQSIPKSDFKRCYDDWLQHLQKCIASRGEYFEGIKLICNIQMLIYVFFIY